jgi:phage-related protein
VALTVGELNAYLRLDDGTFVRALDAAGARFAAFKADIDRKLAELKRSLKDMSAEVKITADTKPAERDVRAFIRRMNALKISINVNVSIVQALQRLQQIEDRIGEVSRMRATVRVRAETGDTLAALRAIMTLIDRIDRAHPSFTVNASTARAEAALRRLERAQSGIGNNSGISRAIGWLSSLGSSAGGAASSLASVAATAGLIAGALGAAIPVAAGLVAALVNIAPAAAIGATAVFSLASAFGAVKLGTSGIGGAFKAAFAPAVGGGGGAAKAANQAASALRAVKDAQKQAAYANQAAARTTADAERQVADAQKAAKRAQDDLNDSREQAQRDLRDMNESLKDAYLDQEQAVQDVEDAQLALQAVQGQGSSASQHDLDEAELAYRRAVQRLEEQKIATKDLAEDTKKANDAGVDGSQTMVDARQKVSDSNRTVADEERNLADARVQQARTAAAGLESIQKAQEALAASAASAGGGGGGVDKLGQALAALSPNARAFVLQVIALKGAWHSMQQAVQNKLFEGLAGNLKTTAGAVLPVLRKGLISSAGALNLMAKGAMTAATSVARDGTLGKALSSASAGLHNLAGVPGIVVKSLTQLAAAAGPQFQKLTAAMGRGAASIGASLDKAFKNGNLEKAIDTAVGLIKQIGKIAVNVGSVLGSIFSAANASGGGFLNTLQTITGALATAFKSEAVQDGLRALFQTMALVARTAGPLLIQALGLIGPVLTALAPPVQDLVRALGAALGPVLKAIAPLIQILGTTLVPLITLAVQALGPVIVALAKPLGVVIQALGAGLKPIIVALGPVLLAAANALGQLAVAFAPLLPVIGQMVAALGPVLTPVLGVIGVLFKALAPVISQLGKSLLPPFLKITTTLAGVFKQLSPALGKALDQLGRKGLVPVVAALGTAIGDMVTRYAGMFVSMFKQLLPVIPLLIPVVVQLAQSLSQILVALAPLLPQLMLLTAQMITQLLPAIIPLLPALTHLEVIFLELVTGVITKVVIPVFGVLVKVFQGLQRAVQPALTAVTWLTKAIAGAFKWLYDVLLGHSIIPDIVNGIVRWFASLPGKAWNALSGLGGNLYRRAADAGNRMIGAISTAIGAAVSWIRDLPGRASSALGNLGGTLYKAGQALLRGFIDGIRSMGGIVNNAVSSIVSGARDYFPFSPARKGAFSGRGYPLYSGMAIGQSLAAGLAGQQGLVGAAARAVASAAHDGLGMPGTPVGTLVAPQAPARGAQGSLRDYGPDGQRTPIVIENRLILDPRAGTDDLVKVVQKWIRVTAGGGPTSVQDALGQVG